MLLKTQGVRRITAGVAFCALLAVALSAADFVLTPSRGTTDPWPAVRATAGQADVVALGSSRTYCAIMPMEMWRSAGITALDVTGPSQPYAITEAFLEQALEYQKPKVVLLEIYTFGQRTPFDMAKAHTNLDSMPDGPVRTRAVLSSVPATGLVEAFVPLILYHNRWDALALKDFHPTKFTRYAYARGAKYVPGIGSVPATDVVQDVPGDLYARDLAHARDIARLCAAHGATLVLLKTPGRWRATSGGMPLEERIMRDLATGPGAVRYLDADAESASMGIDPTTDYKDLLHLNHAGAVKMSRWLATRLARDFGVADRRGAAFAARWDADLALYDGQFVGTGD